MPDDDALHELIRRCQEGEVSAFATLFDVYHRRVYNVAYALSGDSAAAADVVQEVFVKLLARIRQFRFGSAFDTWLHRIVVNAAHDQHRLRRGEPLDGRLFVADAAQQRRLEEEERERAVRAAIASLTPRLRAPIVLRYVAELSYDEIARVLDVSPGTVASRLARGHAALARSLAHLRGAR